MLLAGRYRLHTAIGRGAMGEVWRARDEVLGTDVAVKLLLAQGADPTSAARFRLEAQTAGSLNHPHVVRVHDFGAHEDRLFLVMELVEGDTLTRMLSMAGRLPAEQVARIAAQAAAGLAAAHRQGIVHRDIKPGNLLLHVDGAVKIGDFGIARFLDDPGPGLTATGQVVGTSLYLAPERALGQPAGPASDVYALGCVLYQLLTGRPPFQADSAIAVLHHHLDTPATPPRHLGIALPPAFENYLLGMLAKKPEARPAAQQVADWFDAGSWRGHPEPLPATVPEEFGAPALYSARQRPFMSGQSRPTGGKAAGRPLTEPGPATAYGLPASGARVTARRDRRTAPRTRGTHRPKAVGAVAAAVLFLAATAAGAIWFTAGSGSANTTVPDAPPTTTPSSAAGTGVPSAQRPGETVPTDTSTPEQQPKQRPQEKAGKKEHGGRHKG
ncbi:protein kinase [Streptomyces sp. NPDC091215]|uniref:serine/threonine-protein kinase n=2 Tax=unclassified Streptomyces TaxID=2593676 RepID=UPI003426DE4F